MEPEPMEPEPMEPDPVEPETAERVEPVDPLWPTEVERYTTADYNEVKNASSSQFFISHDVKIDRTNDEFRARYYTCDESACTHTDSGVRENPDDFNQFYNFQNSPFHPDQLEDIDRIYGGNLPVRQVKAGVNTAWSVFDFFKQGSIREYDGHRLMTNYIGWTDYGHFSIWQQIDTPVPGSTKFEDITYAKVSVEVFDDDGLSNQTAPDGDATWTGLMAGVRYVDDMSPRTVVEGLATLQFDFDASTIDAHFTDIRDLNNHTQTHSPIEFLDVAMDSEGNFGGTDHGNRWIQGTVAGDDHRGVVGAFHEPNASGLYVNKQTISGAFLAGSE